jgi:hypothetical protein
MTSIYDLILEEFLEIIPENVNIVPPIHVPEINSGFEINFGFARFNFGFT